LNGPLIEGLATARRSAPQQHVTRSDRRSDSLDEILVRLDVVDLLEDLFGGKMPRVLVTPFTGIVGTITNLISPRGAPAARERKQSAALVSIF
jgi:hypothetical protein